MKLVNDAEAREPETELSPKVQLAVASFTAHHHQLDRTAFCSIFLSLFGFARAAGCHYHFNRQVLRRCRDDKTLMDRVLDCLLTRPHGFV